MEATTKAVQVEAGAFELINADGRWVGTQTTVGGPGIDLPGIIVFSGQDAYDGLTAYIGVDWSASPTTLNGLIFSGDMPAFPEPSAVED